MKLFGFNKKKSKLAITKDDRGWVEENFQFLVSVFGSPSSSDSQIVICEESFPKLFSTKEIEISKLFDDLSVLFGFNRSELHFEVQEGVESLLNVPYEIFGKETLIETLITSNNSKLFISGKLLTNPSYLIYKVVYEFIKIRLIKSNVQYDTGNDTELFIYLAGIYFGFGVVLSQNLINKGRESIAGWDRQWSYVSKMPEEVMSYALALHTNMVGNDNPRWKPFLSNKFIINYDLAHDFLKNTKNELVNNSEFKARDYWRESLAHFQNGVYEEGMEKLNKILFLTKDELFRADVYNQLGYYQSLQKDYSKSANNFLNCLKIEPNHAYALCNLSYAYLMMNDLSEAKYYLDKAKNNHNTDMAYYYRNLAIYYELRGELELAEVSFQKAFENVNEHVDLLEYYYGRYLYYKIGDKVNGVEYLQKSVDKNEGLAIDLMNKITNS